MVRKSYTPEQILNKLREAEILLNQGTALSVVWKKIGVSDCTYYRWRKEYGGMRIEQARFSRALRCCIVTVPRWRSMSWDVRATASETRQPSRERSLTSKRSRRLVVAFSSSSTSSVSRYVFITPYSWPLRPNTTLK